MEYDILIAGNNLDDLKIFEEILHDIDCTIIITDSGADALEMVKTMNVALIILDVLLPDMNGFEVAESIMHSKESTIPIIFVSDKYKDTDYIFKGYEVGAVDFLFKPVDPFILKHKANVFLKLFQYESELKSRLKELQDKNIEMAKLNTQINEYAGQLELKTTEAERANKAKSLFLANISHEIRTPMNAILGFTDILFEDEYDPIKKGKLEIIKQSGEFLLNLINDILDLSKIEAEKIEIVNSEFSILKLFEEMYFLFNETARTKGLFFNIDVKETVPEFVYGDERYLKQVIMNLVGNSFKFTEKGGVEIISDYKEKQIEVTIIDTGIGIDKDDLDKIFDAFKQINEAKISKYKGTGLGLTISKSLIELMGGELSAQSTLGRGSTFKIKMPLKAIDHTQSAAFNGRSRDQNIEEMVERWLDNFKNEPLLLDILLRAIRSMPARIIALDESIKNNNKKEIEFLSHTIKGFAGSVKMIEISELAKKMEQETKKEDFDMEKIKIYHSEMKFLVDNIPSVYKDGKTIKDNSQPKKNQLSILVAEDDDVNQEIIKVFLNRMGFSCDIAENGKVVLERLKETHYDVLLLDIGMPIMDGLETIKAIREMNEYKHLRVIALTAYSMKGDKEKFLAAGFDDYISKPIDRQKLWKKVWK